MSSSTQTSRDVDEIADYLEDDGSSNEALVQLLHEIFKHHKDNELLIDEDTLLSEICAVMNSTTR